MLSARHRIVCVEDYGIKTLDSVDKVVVDVRPPKRMKKRRELDALATAKKHASGSSTANARSTDRRALVGPEDSSSSDVFVSSGRGPCQLITSRYWCMCDLMPSECHVALVVALLSGLTKT